MIEGTTGMLATDPSLPALDQLLLHFSVQEAVESRHEKPLATDARRGKSGDAGKTGRQRGTVTSHAAVTHASLSHSGIRRTRVGVLPEKR